MKKQKNIKVHWVLADTKSKYGGVQLRSTILCRAKWFFEQAF